MNTKPAIVAASLLLSACASYLTVSELTDQSVGADVPGIPFHVPRSYKVSLYECYGSDGNSVDTGNAIQDANCGAASIDATNGAATPTATGTGAYKPSRASAQSYQSLPDPRRVYVLGFHGEPLSNPTVNISLNSDGTIASAGLTTAPSGQQALSALTNQITAVSGAFSANNTTKLKSAGTYASAVAAYYTALQTYCTASKATPLDTNAAQVAAANVLVSEVALSQAHDAAGSSDPLPYAQFIKPQSDVGVGCPS